MFFVLLKVLGVILAGWVAYSTATFLYHSWCLRRFPGPLSFPIIGSLYDPGFLAAYKHFLKLRMKYGRVLLVFFANRPTLMIADPWVARRILADSKTFYKGEDYWTYVSRLMGMGMITANGEQHQHGRSSVSKFFIRSSIAPMAPVLDRIVRGMIASYIEPEVAAARTTGGKSDGQGLSVSLNMEDFFARLSLRVIIRFLCGKDSSENPELEAAICHAVSDAFHAVAITLLTGQPNWSIFPQTQLVQASRQLVIDFFETCTAERRARIAAGESFDDVLQTLLNDSSISQAEREDQFVTFIAAGHDTTTYFMSYFVYLLAKHPEVQEKIHAHIEEVLGTDIEREVTADDTARLKYLRCAMMEALRLYTVVPSVSRECSEDVYIKEEGVDVVIPAHTHLVVLLQVLNRDPEIWENPDEFNPDRFASKPNMDFTLAKNGFFPFTYGSRVCIGNTLAQMESTIAFVHLLRRFKFLEDKNFRPKIRGGISLTTSNGIKVVVSPR